MIDGPALPLVPLCAGQTTRSPKSNSPKPTEVISLTYCDNQRSKSIEELREHIRKQDAAILTGSQNVSRDHRAAAVRVINQLEVKIASPGLAHAVSSSTQRGISLAVIVRVPLLRPHQPRLPRTR